MKILVFSSNSERLAYAAQKGNKCFVVVDGKEGKKYDSICPNSVIFSPDSKRVAYAAIKGIKRLLVIDENEGKEYDNIITAAGGRIIFDSPNSLHYLAQKGTSIYLVKEQIRTN